MENQHSIKIRMIRNSVGIMLVAFAIMGTFVFNGLVTIGDLFGKLSEERSSKFQSELSSFSQKSKQRTKELYLSDMKRRSKDLIQKDGSSLILSFQDNSFSQVREFLEKVFSTDEDVVHTSFFVYEGGELKAWQYNLANYPEGLDLPLVYDFKDKKWRGTYKGKKIDPIYDPSVANIVRTRELTEQQFNLHPLLEQSMIEVSVPISKEYAELPNKNQVTKLIKKSEPVGYLRYLVSLEGIDQAIEEEDKQLHIYLGALSLEEAESRKRSQEEILGFIHKILFFFIALMLCVSFVSYLLAGYLSRRISDPIRYLTEMADKLSMGDYTNSIEIPGRDEVASLASSFENMRRGILTRDSELEKLNRSLERKVAERTIQLKEEHDKVTNLLDNMRQAVFIIGASRKVIAPVSAFSEELFGFPIEGMDVLDLLFLEKRNPQERQNFYTAISVIFGEDDLQWSLMEDNFPPKLYIGFGDIQKILKVKYIPLWNRNQRLEKLMLIIEDISLVEKMEREMQIARSESGARMRMLKELSVSDPTELKEILNESYHMMESIIYELRTSELKKSIKHDLHTLKGNSRLLGLEQLSGRYHQLEDCLGDESLSSSEFSEESIKAVLSLLEILDEYSSFANEYFKIKNDFELDRFEKMQNHLIQFGGFSKEQMARHSASLVCLVKGSEKRKKIWHSYRTKQDHSFMGVILEELYRYFVVDKNIKVFDRNYRDFLNLYYQLNFEKESSKFLKSRLGMLVLPDACVMSLLDFSFLMEFNMERSFLEVKKAFIESDEDAISSLSFGRDFQGLSGDKQAKLARPLIARVLSNSPWNEISTSLNNVHKMLERTTFAEFTSDIVRLPEKVDPFYMKLIKLFEEKTPIQSYVLICQVLKIIQGFSNQAVLDSYIDGKKVSIYEDQVASLIDSVHRANMEEESREQLLNQIATFSYSSLKASLLKFYTAVQSLATSMGKNVQFHISGDDVYLPKNGMKTIADILNHMIRNSLDHGIEFESDRIAQGKRPEGRILISLKDEGEYFEVQVADDGQGIPIGALRKIIEKRFSVDSLIVASMGEAEVLSYIFKDNLSTKEKLSEISGRGIGLAFVYEQVKKVGGSIQVKNQEGKGCKFLLKLPKEMVVSDTNWTDVA